MQGKTDIHVCGKSYKENYCASDYTISNVLQRPSLSNCEGDRRWQNMIYVTSLASIVAYCMMIM